MRRRWLTVALILATSGLARAERLELQVVRGGRPVAGVLVRLTPRVDPPGDLGGGTCGQGSSNAAGEIAFDGLDRGPYRAEVYEAGHKPLQVKLDFPLNGVSRGRIDLAERGEPTTLRLEAPHALAAGDNTELTITAADANGLPCRDGAWLQLKTDQGNLRAGDAAGAEINLGFHDGRATARFSCGEPALAEITATCLGTSDNARISVHGALQFLLLDTGPQEKGYPFPFAPPGEDIPIAIRACDVGKRGVPEVPLLVTFQKLPDGPVVRARTETDGHGEAVIFGRTAPEPGRYRVTARSGNLWASEDYRTAVPVDRWLGLTVDWTGLMADVTTELHQKDDRGAVELTYQLEPEGRLLLVDSDGARVLKRSTDDEGKTALHLVRIAPGPATLTVTTDDGLLAWRAVGDGETFLGGHTPTHEAPWPEPAFELDAKATPPAPPAEPSLPRAFADAAFGLTLQRMDSPQPGLPEWLTYRFDRDHVTRHLLGQGTTLGPVRELTAPRRLAVAFLPKGGDGGSLTLRTHEPILGQTTDSDITPTAAALLAGVGHVWDISLDGQTLLLSSKPLLTQPRTVGVWLLNTDTSATLVAKGWRAVTGAAWTAEGGVVVAGTPPEGVKSPALYRVKKAAAESGKG